MKKTRWDEEGAAHIFAIEIDSSFGFAYMILFFFFHVRRH